MDHASGKIHAMTARHLTPLGVVFGVATMRGA
jgi:hypothetical protein